MPVSLAAGSASGISGALYPIRTITLDGSSTSAIFSNIPQTYKHLIISVYARSNFQGSGPQTTFSVYINNAIYSLTSYTSFFADGATVTTGRATSGAFGLSVTIPAGTTDLGFYGTSLIYIPNYTTNKFKTIISKSNLDTNGSGGPAVTTMLYRDAGAVTNINLATNGQYHPGSTFSLYGLAGN